VRAKDMIRFKLYLMKKVESDTACLRGLEYL
jgi:hypothetical protein